MFICILKILDNIFKINMSEIDRMKRIFSDSYESKFIHALLWCSHYIGERNTTIREVIDEYDDIYRTYITNEY